jgi:hypothetical protein
LEQGPAPEAVAFVQRPDKDRMDIFSYETITTTMKSLYIYIVLMTGAFTASQAQNIYSGGRGDGFAFQQMGFGIFAGGAGSGFAFATIGTPDQGVPLPITLLDFTAQRSGTQVLLQWQTSMEDNNDHFEVERSSDGAVFLLLTSVASHGNTTTQQHYQAIDPNPYQAYNFYRLKQVDKDGKAQYSKIVLVDMSANATDFSVKVYPNPADRSINMDLTSPRSINSMLSLYNAEGTLIAKRYCRLVAGVNHLSWDISHLSAGTYYCKVENTNWPVISFIKK